MDNQERLNVWTRIAAQIRTRIVDNNGLGNDDVAARIRADDANRLRQAEGFIAMYEKKLAQA
jgi:hypothetical protein